MADNVQINTAPKEWQEDIRAVTALIFKATKESGYPGEIVLSGLMIACAELCAVSLETEDYIVESFRHCLKESRFDREHRHRDYGRS